MSLTARYLEENGIATVVLGSARDVVEHCAVPRFVFTDFPLGNPCGKPYDRAMQLAVVEAGLGLLESATVAQTTVKTPFVWAQGAADAQWRSSYMRVDETNLEALRAAGELRRRQRADGRVRSRGTAS